MNAAPDIFVSKEQLEKRVTELGQAITRDLAGKNVVCVGILKGSFVFFADLVRHINLPVMVDFFGASSYGEQTISSGRVKITLDLSVEIAGKHVLIVEDIVDTGLTLNYIVEYLRLKNPKSLRTCALLLKPGCLKRPTPIDYLGFTVDNRFIVGYGLDAEEKYRNLPYLAIVPEHPSPTPNPEEE
jgi:hypoxanthine phosphoribosyltransferase